MAPRPLLHRLHPQRAFADWVEGHHARMSPEMRAEAERIHRWLYSRAGWPAWLGALSVAAGLALLLGVFGGLPAPIAVAVGVLAVLVMGTVWMEAWFFPHRFASGRNLARTALAAMGLSLLGAVVGYAAARMPALGGGWLDPGQLRRTLQGLLLAMLAGTLLMVPMLGLQWALARVRRGRLEREVAELRLAQERQAHAREVAEARLRLLQAQVHPHFVFNTLAAVQHWVDQGDPRAAPLLRALTAFLRGSTEMLGRERTTLGEEAAMAGHYLAIMGARLGQRLSSRIEVPEALAATELPPGLLLTLVENAVEHGIEPTLAGGTVSVMAELNEPGHLVRVRVRDDGLGLSRSWQEGVGLANCRQRLVHHFGSSARLQVHACEPGTEAVLSWPAAGASP